MNEDLKLGSAEAAVRSCVNMLAALTSQREEHLAYWLDLYYQVRRAYEIESGGEPDPQLIRKDELLPILEATVREALRGTARKAAETVTEKRKTRKPAGSDQIRSLSPSGSSPSQEEPKRGQDEAEPATAKKPGPWTLFKKKQFERLWNARQAGYTIAQICQASDGALSERKIMDALNSAQLSQEDWRALEKTLDAVDRMPIPAGY